MVTRKKTSSRLFYFYSLRTFIYLSFITAFCMCLELVYSFGIVVYSACWNRTNDIHGFHGTPRNLSSVDECQAACINNSTCVAIDWESRNATQICWILTLRVTSGTMTTGVIVHYELDRDCLS